MMVRVGSPFSIRPATTDDVTGILACLGAAFEPYRAEYTPAAFADTVLDPETLRQRLLTMSILVAVDDAGTVVGTIGYRLMDDGTRGHLRGMAVLPDRKGSGLAAALMHSVESELERQHCTRMTPSSVAPLQRAIAFYERRGFRRTGQVRDFFGMPLFEFAMPLGPSDSKNGPDRDDK
jgi:ribosomal protein S18 acetylase RimI-like enzyme